MYKFLSLFFLSFVFQTGLYAQNDSTQSAKIMGHWVLLDVKDQNGAIRDYAYDGDKVPAILTDIKIKKKKAISSYKGDSREARWIVRNGSLFFYFDLIQTERVYRIVSISATELKLQKDETMGNGSLRTVTITYKRQ